MASAALPPAAWSPSGAQPIVPVLPADDGEDGGWQPVSAAARGGRRGRSDLCWNCGQSNARGREYCRRCGQRLISDLGVNAGTARQMTPVSGSRGRQAVAFIWTVLVLAAVVVVGVIAFGGFLPRDIAPAASPSIAPSASPLGSPAASAAPSASPSAASSPSPDATPSAAASGAPSVVPVVSPSPTGSALASAAPSATPTATGTPTPTVAATATATPGTSLPPRQTATPSATGTPIPLGSPTARPISTATPGPVTSTASPRAPTPQSFRCEGSLAALDPLRRAWRLGGIYWAGRTDFDRVTLRLVPDSARDGRGRVNVETRAIADLEAMGLPEPADGEIAVIVRFSPAVVLPRELQGTPALTAVGSLVATRTDDGRVWVVLGVDGQGCTALQVPMWDDPSTQDTPFVDVTVDVQH